MKIYSHCIFIITLLFIYIFPINAQESPHGVYKYSISKNDANKCIIRGKIIDKETQKVLKIAVVKINDKLTKADTSGTFLCEVAAGKYVISGLCYPYHRVETKPIYISKGETISVVFRLIIDKSPIID